MCGRYIIDESVIRAIKEITGKTISLSQAKLELFPGSNIPLIVQNNNQLIVKKGKWGFKVTGLSKLIFNARLETIAEKPLFKDHYQFHRCLIPAQSYYEWDKSKVRHNIKLNETLFFAGIYRVVNKEIEVVIVTCKPSDLLSEIHHRMPLMLNKKQQQDWLSNRYLGIYPKVEKVTIDQV